MEKSILCFSQESRWAGWTLTPKLRNQRMHLHQRLFRFNLALRTELRVESGLLGQ